MQGYASVACSPNSPKRAFGNRLPCSAKVGHLARGRRAEALEQALTRGEIADGFGMVGMVFVLLAEPAGAAEPGDGAFHHPAARQEYKPLRLGRALHNLQVDAIRLLGPLHQRPPV